MTSDSREGGDPPNNSNGPRRKPRAASLSAAQREIAEDLATIIIVAAREAPENRWGTLEVGLRQFITKWRLLNNG